MRSGQRCCGSSVLSTSSRRSGSRGLVEMFDLRACLVSTPSRSSPLPVFGPELINGVLDRNGYRVAPGALLGLTGLPRSCLGDTASQRSTGRRRAYSALGVGGGSSGSSAGVPGRGSSQMRLNSPIKSVVLAVDGRGLTAVRPLLRGFSTADAGSELFDGDFVPWRFSTPERVDGLPHPGVRKPAHST